MQYFIVSYDNPFMITHTLSMRCSASLMYVSSDNHDLSLNYFIVYVIFNVYVKQI